MSTPQKEPLCIFQFSRTKGLGWVLMSQSVSQDFSNELLHLFILYLHFIEFVQVINVEFQLEKSQIHKLYNKVTL